MKKATRRPNSQVSRHGLLPINIRSLAVWGALFLALTALMGCGGGGATPTTQKAGEAKAGGTLSVAMLAGTVTLDPAVSLGSPDVHATQQTYDNLVWIQHDQTLKPMLATSWASNAALTEWTFNLRSGVKFHHGKVFNSQDVVYTFKRLLDPKTASAARSNLDFVEDIVAVDDLTVRFVLKTPNAFLPSLLSMYQARIVPSDVDPSKLATQEFGTGPFIITEHLPEERTVFKRNPDYWEKDRPYVDQVIFFYMPQPETRVEALKTGSVDVLYPLEASSIPIIETSPGTRVDEIASASYLTMVMNTKVSPFDNKKVRLAFQAATDRDAIRKAALLGRGVLANDHPIPPNDPHYWQGQEIRKYDIERAKRLLAEAGYPNGIDVTLHTSTIGQGAVEMAVTFKESAAPAGIRVSIKRQPEDIYWAKIWMAEDFFVSQWNARSPDEALSISVKGDAKWNEAFFVHPRIDELILKARGQTDLQQRKESYAEIQRILMDEVPRLIPVFRPIIMGLRENVQGVKAHPNNWLSLSDAWFNR